MKKYHFSHHEHVQQDLESLIPHLKSCMVCNRFKATVIDLWEMFKHNLSRRTFTTVCLLGGILKVGIYLV